MRHVTPHLILIVQDVLYCDEALDRLLDVDAGGLQGNNVTIAS